jgi:hypothetical protein
MQNVVGTILKNEENTLVSLLAVLSDKRAVVNKAIRSFYARLGEIDENLERVAQLGDVQPSADVIEEPSWFRNVSVFYEIDAIGVCPKVKHFLANHSHVYKRLVKKQLDWIIAHKDNLLQSENGFSQYTFDPKEYMIAGSIDGETDDVGRVMHVTNDLPGDVLYGTVVPPTPTWGYAAVDAMLASGGALSYPDPTARPRMHLRAAVLSIEDIKARSAEVKSLLEDIRHWSDVAYMHLWKDAIYDCDVIEHLLTSSASSINQRGLTALASVVVDLLHKADGGVGGYALTEADALLQYIEESLAKYVTHTEEFSK